MKRTSRSRIRQPALSLMACAVAQLVVMAAAPAAALAAPAPTSAPVQPVTLAFQQERQALGDALLAIARKALVTVSFDPALVAGLSAAPVQGMLTVDQALQAALQGSGLSVSRTPAGAYVIGRQPGGAAAAAAAARGEKKDLATVIVSAERQEDSYVAGETSAATRSVTPVMDTAQSVSSVSKKLMNDQQINNVLDALRNVSGVSQSSVPNGPQPNIQIRGFIVDSVASDGLMSYGTMDLYTPTIALEKVEVIKGPESIMGGTGAAFGGVINMVAKTPQAVAATEIQSTIDSNGRLQLGADLTGALNEGKQLRGRVVVSAEKGSDTDLGWNGGDNYYLAPSLAWKDSVNSVLLAAEAQNYRRPFGNFAYSTTDVLRPDAPAASHAPDDGFHYKFFKASLDVQRILANDWMFRLRGRHQKADTAGEYWVQNPTVFPAGEGTLLALLAYAQQASYTVNSVQADLARRYVWGKAEHRLLVGADFKKITTTQEFGFRYDTDLTVVLPAGGTSILPSVASLPNTMTVVPESTSATKERGVFLQDQIAVGERWQALLAGRYMAYRPQGPSADLDLSKFLPSLGLVYKPVADVSLYGSFNKGITATANYRTRAGEILPPTQARQFELGVKQSYFNGRLLLTSSVFHVKKTDVVVADLDNSGFYHTEAGQVSRGVELEANGSITPALSLSAAYTYAASRDQAGRSMLGLARHTVNLWANYRFATANSTPGAGAFNLGAGINARSRLDYHLPGVNIMQRNPGAARIDVVLGYDTRLWSLKLGVRNLADRVLFSTGSTVAAAEVEPRRMVTLSGTYKF